MHIGGFFALTVTPFDAHCPDGPYLHGFKGAAHFGGQASSHGGGHGFAHGGGHTGSHGGGQALTGAGHGGGHGAGGGQITLGGSAQIGLQTGGHGGLIGSQIGSHGELQLSPYPLVQPVHNTVDILKTSNEAKIPSCFLIKRLLVLGLVVLGSFLYFSSLNGLPKSFIPYRSLPVRKKTSKLF